MRKLLLIISVFAMTISGCTKKRETRLEQGAGKDLYLISELDGKEFDLKVGEKIESKDPDQLISSNKEAEVGSEAWMLKPVKYKSTEDLVKDVVIRGMSNQTYKLRYELTETLLKIYKVAKEEYVPRQERTYGTKEDKDLIAIPLMGYPVTYYRLDAVKDANNKDTHILKEFPGKKEESTHLRIDKNSPVVFEAVTKVNVFPANAFDGIWYYAETIIGTRLENQEAVGRSSSIDVTLKSSEKIRFIRTQDGLRGVNVNIDQRLEQKNELSFSPVINIPGEWVQFQLKAKTGKESLKEVSVSEDTVEVSKRQFVKLNLAGVTTVANGGLDSKVVDVEMGEDGDYFGFTLLKLNDGKRIKYSFLKSGERNYERKLYSKEDRTKLGFFHTVEAFEEDYTFHRRKDLENKILLNRFNPKKKEIVFHLSQGTPDKYIDALIAPAIHSWDNTFQKVGVSVKLAKDPAENKVSLGDLRYNVINIIDSVGSGGRLLGFGPSLTDPQTGEIISATTNLHISPIREGLIHYIRTYLSYRMGDYEGIDTPYYVAPVVPEKEILEVGSNDLVKKALTSAGTSIKFEDLIKNDGFSVSIFKNESYSIPSKNIKEDIETFCGVKARDQDDNILEPYLEKVKAGELSVADDQAIVRACADRLIPRRAMLTLLHEMGHNFGLRHNFMGSTDKAHFPAMKTIDRLKTQKEDSAASAIEKSLVKALRLTKVHSVISTSSPDVREDEAYVMRSSTVMDYLSSGEDTGLNPGPYDQAAIQFGYGDVPISKIEKDLAMHKGENGELQPLPMYRFCTDEGASGAASISPLCERHDAGTNLKEIVKSHILDFWSNYAVANFRRDRVAVGDAGIRSLIRMMRHIIPLRRIYDEWRLQLARYRGKKADYLEEFNSAAEYTEFLKSIKDENLLELKAASDEIFEFFRRLIFLENEYCLAVKTDGKGGDIVEMEKIRQGLISAGESVTIGDQGCMDPAVVGYLAKKDLRSVDKVGYPIKSFRHHLGEEENVRKISIWGYSVEEEPMDVLGLEVDRIFSAIFMSARGTDSHLLQQRGFVPSMLDEPDYREEMSSRLVSRLVDGVRLEGIDFPFLKFSEERKIFTVAYKTFLQGLFLPGKATENSMRMAKYGFDATPVPEMAQKATESLAWGPIFYLAYGDDKAPSTQMMRKLKSNLGLLSLKPVSMDDYAEFKTFVESLPKSTDPMTVGELREYGDTLIKMLETGKVKLGRSPKAFLKFIGPFTDGGFMSALEETAKTMPPEQLSVLLSMDVKDFAKANEQEVHFYSDFWPELEKEISGFVAQFKVMSDFVESHREEFEAQRDLLSDIVRGSVGER